MEHIVNEASVFPALVAKTAQMTALIVDDDETDRRRIRRFCRDAGMQFQMSEAGDLRELRTELNRRSFDVIFLDYHLGMETGLEALHLVTAHEDQEDALVIMVTSVGMPDVIIEAMRSGCADYIIKEELSVDLVRRSISSAIERRILLAAISRRQKVRNAMNELVERFANSCAPEMRRILAGMMRRLRTIQGSVAADAMHSDIEALRLNCEELYAFLDGMRGMLELEAADLPSQRRTITERFPET